MAEIRVLEKQVSELIAAGSTSDTAQTDANASPRNPKVPMCSKSLSVCTLLVPATES